MHWKEHSVFIINPTATFLEFQLSDDNNLYVSNLSYCLYCRQVTTKLLKVLIFKTTNTCCERPVARDIFWGQLEIVKSYSLDFFGDVAGYLKLYLPSRLYAVMSKWDKDCGAF